MAKLEAAKQGMIVNDLPGQLHASSGCRPQAS